MVVDNRSLEQILMDYRLEADEMDMQPRPSPRSAAEITHDNDIEGIYAKFSPNSNAAIAQFSKDCAEAHAHALGIRMSK